MGSEEAAKRKKITKNPLENVIHWVIEPPKQDQPTTTHQGGTQTANQQHPKRPDPPKRGDSSKRISVQKIQEYREVTNL